ncbi:MAG: RNA polymerase-binding protein DksA [Rhodospirillales bacterium]|nr:RNA polymerase-binding protein DksA [Rhodospirillales bacterium]
MSPRMREYFRRKLEMWRQDILNETDATLEKLRLDTGHEADLGDRAAVESERSVQLRTRDRARKLISKIESALQRIDNGSYGYCEETAEPISIRRLEARPIATLSVEAQERHERHERTHRDG